MESGCAKLCFCSGFIVFARTRARQSTRHALALRHSSFSHGSLQLELLSGHRMALYFLVLEHSCLPRNRMRPSPFSLLHTHTRAWLALTFIPHDASTLSCVVFLQCVFAWSPLPVNRSQCFCVLFCFRFTRLCTSKNKVWRLGCSAPHAHSSLARKAPVMKGLGCISSFTREAFADFCLSQRPRMAR
jgi:hypothetical protein